MGPMYLHYFTQDASFPFIFNMDIMKKMLRCICMPIFLN